MSEEFEPPPHSFVNKFKCAFRGIAVGSRSQSSLLVHLVAAALVIGVGAWLKVSAVEWCLLALCIAVVLALELFNSSIESLARAIDRRHNEQLRDALDIASGAVLVGAIGAAVVGIVILLPRFLQTLG
ncbi:MAG: diacylglycerol kinase [Planctomycetota bacterium]|nr:diacylglycerol kinase [Planctomycetota bacterium]